MTVFVHVDQPTHHPGVVRAERAFALASAALRGLKKSQGTATLLLAAMVSALLVVANQVIETWTEGHLLAAWIALWTIAFAGLALLAGPAGRVVARARAMAGHRAAARRQAAQDDAVWEVALSDARVMAEVNRAMSAEDATRAPRA